MTTSRRRGRAGGTRVAQADIPPRHHWRFRFQTSGFGEVVFHMAGTETRRVLTEQPHVPGESGHFCIPHYDPARFAQLMADPEVSQGYINGLKHKGNPTG